MTFTRYDTTAAFAGDALGLLLEHEVQNNLLIGFIRNERGYDTSDWLLSTIKDESGSVALVAACTPPFNLVLYETGNKPSAAAVQMLSKELKGMGFALPGVLAEQSLAHRFAQTHVADGAFRRHMSMHVMRLDSVSKIDKAPGACRKLHEGDFFFMPYWEKEFCEECQTHVDGIQAYVEKLKQRLDTGAHYIWENAHPVSCAFNARNTENGAGINGVYTPPHYRGKGYASSLVAELSQSLLERGNKFCFLFVNAENPNACAIYRKIGFHNLCLFDEIKFGGK